MRIFKKVLIVCALIAALLGGSAAACVSDADRVNENLNTAAENFEISRTIVFYNVWTDKYVAVVKGRCSIERDADMMQAICKTGPKQFTRDEIGRSANLTYVSLQDKPIGADDYRKKIVLKPGNALPDFDVNTGEK